LKKFQINLRDPVEKNEFIEFYIKLLEEHQGKTTEVNEEQKPVESKELSCKIILTHQLKLNQFLRT
jgi:hypothetical protein